MESSRYTKRWITLLIVLSIVFYYGYCETMMMYFANNRSFDASFGFEKLVKVQQQQNISWQNSPKTTPVVQPDTDEGKLAPFLSKTSAPLACCTPSHKRCAWVSKAPYTIPECEEQNLQSLLQWLNTILHDVSWWITEGTLLGAVRNESHIPHETDIDVSILDVDWSKAVSQIEAQLRTTHFEFKSFSNPARLFFSKQNRVHVDFWKVQRQSDIIIDTIPVAGKKN